MGADQRALNAQLLQFYAKWGGVETTFSGEGLSAAVQSVVYTLQTKDVVIVGKMGMLLGPFFDLAPSHRPVHNLTVIAAEGERLPLLLPNEAPAIIIGYAHVLVSGIIRTHTL